jgi:uncharacterized protein Yka (UPF0111/DUF47 family)
METYDERLPKYKGYTIREQLDKKVEEALDAADKVERLEEETDDLYRNARGQLSELTSDQFTVGQVILLAEFMDAVENIADRCEDVCDQARVIAVSVNP